MRAMTCEYGCTFTEYCGEMIFKCPKCGIIRNMAEPYDYTDHEKVAKLKAALGPYWENKEAYRQLLESTKKKDPIETPKIIPPPKEKPKEIKQPENADIASWFG